MLGTLDFFFGHSHSIWRPVRSTKQIQQNRQQSLTLVAVSCRTGSANNPVHLLRSARRIPASEGALFWWDHRDGELLFMLPNEQLTVESLEERLNVLATYIDFQGKSENNNPIISYRVVEFSSITGTPAPSMGH